LGGVLDANGGGAFTTDTKITATQSQNGNATFQCKADVTPSTSGSAAQFDFASTGFLWRVPDPFGFQTTDNWKETVSASGNATLTCQLPPQK
jgi:hypothetical protein